MDDLVSVHVMDTVQELLRPRLDMILRKTDLRSLKDSSEVVF